MAALAALPRVVVLEKKNVGLVSFVLVSPCAVHWVCMCRAKLYIW